MHILIRDNHRFQRSYVNIQATLFHYNASIEIGMCKFQKRRYLTLINRHYQYRGIIMSQKVYYLIFVLLLFAIPLKAHPQSIIDKTTYNKGSGTKEDPYIVPRVSSTIKVDASLNEEAWNNALTLELKYEFDPLENAPAPVKTEVLLIYDADCLYVGFRSYHEDVSALLARLKDRDTIWGDDSVGVILDTYNDEKRCFSFRCNALGVQMDGNDVYDTIWDGLWDSAGEIREWGYCVEMAIPFATLNFQRTDGPQTWGFDAIRRYFSDDKHRIGLFPRDMDNFCYLCQAVKIKGFDGASPSHQLEINPTVTAVRTDKRKDFPEGDFTTDHKDVDTGVTFKWGITPNVTLQNTINPDFSQVEADSRQLDINTPFALYYPEKRPFFIEDSDIFYTPAFRIVHTRTMRDPNWGIKLTGNAGGNMFGAYVIRDDLTNLIFPGSQYSQTTSMPIESTSTILSYKRDVWNTSTVSLIYTGREGKDYSNRVFGVDSDIRWGRNWSILTMLAGSSTDYPDEIAYMYDQPNGNFNDLLLYGAARYSSRKMYFITGYRQVGDDFRADVGHVTQVGYRTGYIYGHYNWFAKMDEWYKVIRVVGEYRYLEDIAGQPLYRGYKGSFILNPLFRHSMIFDVERSFSHYNGKDFNISAFSVTGDTRFTKDLYAGVKGGFGDGIDYANTRLGSRININPYLSYYIGHHIQLRFNHTFERMNVNYIRLYTANISQFTGIYHFNNKTFFRAILQYVNYDYNPDNYTYPIDSKYEKFFSQLLFSYKLNPRTVLFIGYGDNYLGSDMYGLMKSEYTLFVKLGYAWTP